MQFGLLGSVWGHGWVVGSLYCDCQVARKEAKKGVCVVGCDTVVLAMQFFARVVVLIVTKNDDLSSDAAFGC